MRSCAASLATVAALSIAGCAQPVGLGPYRPQYLGSRDVAHAEQLNARAADLMDSDPARAEVLLREALSTDLYCGPAHNNLGVLYLSQGQLYEAAGEFEWAKKLLPGHPDPRLNLALTLERAGRMDDAIASYRSALEVYPEHLPTAQALASCQLRIGRTDDDTAHLLQLIALRGDERWKDWANLQAIKMTPTAGPVE